MKVTGYEYDKFDEFVKTFFIEKKSYATTYEQELNLDENEVSDLIDKFNKAEDKTNIEKLNENQKHILVNAIWLWTLPFGNFKRKESFQKNYSIPDITLKDGIWKDQEVGITSMGSNGSVRNTVIPKILGLFSRVAKEVQELNEKGVENIKKTIIKVLYSMDTNSIFMAILHFCDPEHIESICKYSQKKDIVKAFKDFVTDSSNNEVSDDIPKIDQEIWKIRQTLGDVIGNKEFWDQHVVYLWQADSLNKSDLSLVQQLKYKKAMVLYGPPGTGKSYSAEQIAKRLIFDWYKKNNKTKAFFGKTDFNDCIDKKQLHINYTYEDFVGGNTLSGGSVKFKKGYVLNVCDKAKNVTDMPYVVILDEINRVDLSRVFGEVFTAMEKRGETFKTSLLDENGNDVTLKIPKNLYFIGTMNEIDFSLERVDFALRRRFVWNYLGFNKNALEYMLKDYNIELDYDYFNACEQVNKIISDENDLGEKYAIGHCIFADIKEIFNDVNDWVKAVKILWNITIKPTLEAYCGTMQKEQKDNFIKKCQNVFLNAKTEDMKTNE